MGTILVYLKVWVHFYKVRWSDTGSEGTDKETTKICNEPRIVRVAPS